MSIKAEQNGREACRSTAPYSNPYEPLSDDWFDHRKGFLMELGTRTAELGVTINSIARKLQQVAS